MTSTGPNLRRSLGRVMALLIAGAAGIALPLLLGWSLYRFGVWLLGSSK